MILRTVKCAICGAVETEQAQGLGWVGWSGIVGVNLDGDDNPQLCPKHTAELMNIIDRMKNYPDILGGIK